MTNQRKPSASRAIRRAQNLGMTITGIVYLPDGSFRIEFDGAESSERNIEFQLERARQERQRRKKLNDANKDNASGKPPSDQKA